MIEVGEPQLDAVDDVLRRAAIERYDVLLRPPRIDLSAIVEMAARVVGVPMATINLITHDKQHQVATYGFESSVCSREDSMCAQVLHLDSPIIVPDARLDERFRTNPFVTGEIGLVRFYASHRLITPEGVVIGTLCVFDVEPRPMLDDVQRTALRTLAARVVDVLELELRSRDLQSSNERLAAFAGRVSHDLKTPLSSITLALGLLQEQLEDQGVVSDTQQAERLVEKALAGSERMRRLIDDALAYSKLGGRLTREPVDLDAVAKEVVADAIGAHPEASVEAGPMPVVDGDVVQLRSVLQNLVENAIRYRSVGVAPVVRIAAEQQGPMWRVEVSDNGRGIPESARERVFEPRVRLEDDGEGSGLGLDICRTVVRAHGGTIGVDDSPLGGTTMWVELPARRRLSAV